MSRMTATCSPPDFSGQCFTDTGKMDTDKLTPTGWKNKSVGVQCHLVAGGFLEELSAPELKLSTLSHNPIKSKIVNIDCWIKAISSRALLVKWMLSDFWILCRVWNKKSHQALFFSALSTRTKRMTHRSSAVPNVKCTSRGTRAVHRWCARTANMPSAGTVWSPWMWVDSSSFLKGF